MDVLEIYLGEITIYDNNININTNVIRIMSRFMRLTNKIINTSVIHHIDVNKDKFIIHMMANKMYGLFAFGIGTSEAYNTELEICKTKHSIDYKTVTDWINVYSKKRCTGASFL